MLKGKARPVSWGPEEISKALKKQNPVDVAFKEKHQNYEQLQRQATTVCKLITSHFQHSENYFYAYITLISPFNLLQNIDSDEFNNSESAFNGSISLFIFNRASLIDLFRTVLLSNYIYFARKVEHICENICV